MTPEELFNHNERFAYHLAHIWARRLPHIDFDDLKQECLIGLYKASKTFDESKGLAFTTLAGVCMDNQVKLMLRHYIHAVTLMSLTEPLAQDADGSELTLEDILTRPQPLMDFEGEIRESCPTIALRRLYGYTQNEVATMEGIAQPTVSRRMMRERRQLEHALDMPLTPAVPRLKMVAPTAWDLRTEGESGPVTVRRATEDELAMYARQEPKGRRRKRTARGGEKSA